MLKENNIDWSLIVALNDQEVARKNLLQSPCIDAHCQVIQLEYMDNAGAAFNKGIDASRNELLVFAHQDIFLPAFWLNNLLLQISEIERFDPNWGVLGVFGVTNDGQRDGYIFSSGINRILGNSNDGILLAKALDEVVLVMRKSSKLRFDAGLPGFHFYGTDICQAAKKAGKKCYIIKNFCIHNSNSTLSFPFHYWRAYLYMRKKYVSELPIMTTCVRIEHSYLHILKHIFIGLKDHLLYGPVRGKRWDNLDMLRDKILDAPCTERRVK